MSAADLFNQQFGQGSSVRRSNDSVDEIVARNIQEVLQAAQLDDIGLTSGPSMPGNTSQRYGRQTSSTRRVSSDTRAGVNTIPSATSAAPSATSQPANSSSMLDVPGHAEATIRLHKARIKALEDEQAKLTKVLAERDKTVAESAKELRALRAEQANWAKEKKTMELQMERLQRKAADAETALANKESTAKEVNKETSRLEKERRAAEAEAKARDVRLQRALEEVAKHKAMLEELRSQERDTKDVVRTDIGRLTAENKKLERQRAELMLAFKKQLKLIDILKRQRVHLEAAKALQYSEAEFMQLLEMGNTGT